MNVVLFAPPLLAIHRVETTRFEYLWNEAFFRFYFQFSRVLLPHTICRLNENDFFPPHHVLLRCRNLSLSPGVI